MAEEEKSSACSSVAAAHPNIDLGAIDAIHDVDDIFGAVDDLVVTLKSHIDVVASFCSIA